MYTITAADDGTESIAHPNGSHRAGMVVSGPSDHFFGRDKLREALDLLGLLGTETETYINGQKHKVFHDSDVAIVFSKDPFVDYQNDDTKEPVYKADWGGRLNPLRPARPGTIRIVGDRSKVISAFNYLNWRCFSDRESMNGFPL